MADAPSIPEEYLADPNKYFTEWVPKSIAERGDLSEKIGDTNAIIQMQLDGENGGTWHFVIADGKAEVKTGAHDSPSFGITMSVDTWRGMRTKKINPQMAFMTGKLKIKGNMAQAMKLASLFR